MASESEQKKEDWMNSKWRPAMGWLYMFVCLFDFVIAPVLWSILQAKDHGSVTSQWQPLTLQGAGLFHIAMGAVLGIAAYGRTQEKLNGAESGGLGSFGPGVGTTYIPPTATTTTVISESNQPTPAPASSPAPAVNVSVSTAPAPAPAPVPAFGAVTTGFGGKPAPVQAANPVL